MEAYGAGRMGGRFRAPVPCSQEIGAAPPVPLSARKIGHGGEYHAMNRTFLAVAGPGPC